MTGSSCSTPCSTPGETLAEKTTGRRSPAEFQTVLLHRPDETRVRVHPGGYYVGYGDLRIETILGSCVAACARDPVAGVGGINHFMLPLESRFDTATWAPTRSTRYGVHAMEMLINAILTRGGCRERLEFKLFGGGRVLRHMKSDVGANNIAFVRQFAATERLKVVGEDLGDTFSRRLIYDVRSGRALVRRMSSGENSLVGARDQRLIDDLAQHPHSGDVELFDG